VVGAAVASRVTAPLTRNVDVPFHHIVVRLSTSVLTNGRVDLYIALEIDVTVRISNPMYSSMARPSVYRYGALQVTASPFRLAGEPSLTRHMNVSDKEGTPP